MTALAHALRQWNWDKDRIPPQCYFFGFSTSFLLFFYGACFTNNYFWKLSSWILKKRTWKRMTHCVVNELKIICNCYNKNQQKIISFFFIIIDFIYFRENEHENKQKITMAKITGRISFLQKCLSKYKKLCNFLRVTNICKNIFWHEANETGFDVFFLSPKIEILDICTTN